MNASVWVQLQPRGSGSTAVMLDDIQLAVGSGGVVCSAARRLIERGYDPETILTAWRGDVKCLSGPVGAFAKLSVTERSTPRFCLNIPFPGRGVVKGELNP